MRNTKLLIVTLMTTVILTGCGTLLNPYHEDFLCPDGDPGSCTSVKDAYKRSFNPSEAFSPMVKDAAENPADRKVSKEEYRYKEALYKELSGLIKNPTTPMLMPSRQMRVLIPGYVDKDNLYYGHRYIYFVVRDPQWALPVLSDMEDKKEELK
ncbi:MAG: TraV family lipoprotein [Candidatus Promineifilaceae bacterium]|jgi:conjugal transfer pilus assembly protein TraV